MGARSELAKDRASIISRVAPRKYLGTCRYHYQLSSMPTPPPFGNPYFSPSAFCTYSKFPQNSIFPNISFGIERVVDIRGLLAGDACRHRAWRDRPLR